MWKCCEAVGKSSELNLRIFYVNAFNTKIVSNIDYKKFQSYNEEVWRILLSNSSFEFDARTLEAILMSTFNNKMGHHLWM